MERNQGESGSTGATAEKERYLGRAAVAAAGGRSGFASKDREGKRRDDEEVGDV